jgi:hypothetical protein
MRDELLVVALDREGDSRAAPSARRGKLELTLLIARKEPHRHPRLAARWLLRYLEERDEVTIGEAVMAAGSLAALAGDGHEESSQALRAMAERATRRRGA